jgi:undecaprenyl-diphosphatase
MDAVVLFFFFHLTEPRPWLTAFAEFFSYYAIYFAPVALGVYLLAREKDGARKAMYTAASILVSVGFATYILKPFFEKTRPFITLGYAPLVNVPGFSLPSTHAALAGAFFTAAYFTVATNRRSVLSMVWVVSVLIAISRLMLGVHYPSDVIVGFVVGVLVAWIGNRVMIKRS